MKLNIAYLYQEKLDLYGDTGNIEVLKYRAEKRGIKVNVVNIGLNTLVKANTFKDINIVFMGGGPDSGQKDVYQDLVKNKGSFLRDYIEKGGVGLFICGSYQLLGNYYKASDNSILQGLGIFNVYTEHYGDKVPRCIGNVVAELSTDITEDPYFKNNNYMGNYIVGFENHGGRTFLEDKALPFASVLKGNGNNAEDIYEGVIYNNAIGTYFHGPILTKNPHLADFLIAKSLGVEKLIKLDDYIITAAHNNALKLKQ
jgi:lipid II isoglutaminyl synthase (glutamine-hydrolysing)